MLHLKDNYWHQTDQELSQLFYDLFYADLISLVSMDQKQLPNDKFSALKSALRDGKVRYKNGEFTGKFSVAISRELSRFAKLDSRSGIWKGRPPIDIQTVAAAANFRSKAMIEKARRLIDKMEPTALEAARNIRFDFTKPLDDMEAQAVKDMHNLGIHPDMTPEIRDKLLEDYNNNQQLNVKNWSPNQVSRLRDMTERALDGGVSPVEFAQMIMAEWGVTRNKARFLARQETSLFLSKFRRERYTDAGITDYIWMSSADARCRESNKWGQPAHGPGGPLHGHRFTFGDPPPSGPHGEPQEPGEPFGCRCIARPVV